MNELAATFKRFARAICAPRDYENEPCCVCGRRIGEVCDIDRHAELETEAVR